MSTDSHIKILPDETQHIPGKIADTQSILLGGPCTGKTDICKSLDGVEYIYTAEGLNDVDTDYPIILDNAYQILSDPSSDAAQSIAGLKADGASICYVFRPYELEWIISNLPDVNFDFESIQVLSLVYDKDWTFTKLQQVDESLSESKISSFINDIAYEFSFTNAPVDDYQSYLPYCVIKASNTPATNVIAGESVTDKIKSFTEESDLSAFARSAISKLPDSVATALSGVVGGGMLASGMSTVALFAVIPILLSRAANDKHEFERDLGRVLGNELLPHHQEELERETNLPPRTFQTLGEFADPVTFYHLDMIIEEQNEIRSVLEESDISLEHDASSLGELVSILTTETVPITERVSQEFNNAVLPPEALTQQQKNRIVEELGVAAEISQTKAKNRVEDLFSQPLREEMLQDCASDSPDQGALLVYGEMGGGTTTFAQELLEQYAHDGYEVGLINSTTPEVLRSKLRSMQSNSERLALVYSVGRERSISPHDFQILFGKKVFEFYDVIIIDCSQEQVSTIRAAWEQTHDISNNTAKSRLEPKKEIKLSSVNNKELKQVPRTLSSLSDDAVERIASTADGNPMIAVEATLETLEKGIESISGVRGREFIRSRLNGALQKLQENHGEEPIDILLMIAAIRGVGGEKELASLLDINVKSVKVHLENSISSYVHERSDGTLVVTPQIYALTIFEQKWFTKLDDGWISSRKGDQFTDQITNSDDQNLVSLTTNLAELQAHNLNRDVSPSSEIILSIFEDLLKKSKITVFPHILAVAGIYQVPIQNAAITDSKQIHKCLHGFFEASDNGFQNVINSSLPLFVIGLSGVTIAAYEHRDRSAEQFLSIGTNLFREIVDEKHNMSDLANYTIIRYYCGVISPLIYTYDIDDIKPFVEEIRQRAVSIQNGSNIDDVFLIEFYSQILAPHVEVDEGPEKYNDWLDFVVEDITDANEQFGALTGLEMPSEELIVGDPRQFQTSPDRVVVQVFARAIVTNPPQDPTKRLQWIEDTESRLKRFSSRLNDRADSPTGSADEGEEIMSLPLWAAILGQLADFHSPDWAEKWITTAEQRLADDFDKAGSSGRSQPTLANSTEQVTHDGWARFVGDVVFEKRQISEPDRWIDRLVELVRVQTESDNYRDLIQLRSYAWMLCRAVQSLIATDNEGYIETWVQWYFEYATESATSTEVELNSDVVLTEPFVVAPECFQVDVQTNFIHYMIEQLEAKTNNFQYAVIGGCAHALVSESASDSELFDWVNEIICTFILHQDVDDFDGNIVLLYSEVIVYLLDFQDERLIRQVSENILPKLSEREGSESVFDIIVLVMYRLSTVPFDEFGSYAKIVISKAMENLPEAQRKEIRDDLPSQLRTTSDSEHVGEWIEGLIKWTES